MTDRELFEKALEAMEHLHRTGDTQVFDLCYAPELIPALRERLAQPEREWIGLTDEEVVDLKMLGRDLEFVSMTALRRFARAIEAKLKEKNA